MIYLLRQDLFIILQGQQMKSGDHGPAKSGNMLQAIAVEIPAGRKSGVDGIIAGNETVVLGDDELISPIPDLLSSLKLEDKMDRLRTVILLRLSHPSRLRQRAGERHPHIRAEQSRQPGAQGRRIENRPGSQIGQDIGHYSRIAPQAHLPGEGLLNAAGQGRAIDEDLGPGSLSHAIEQGRDQILHFRYGALQPDLF